MNTQRTEKRSMELRQQILDVLEGAAQQIYTAEQQARINSAHVLALVRLGDVLQEQTLDREQGDPDEDEQKVHDVRPDRKRAGVKEPVCHSKGRIKGALAGGTMETTFVVGCQLREGHEGEHFFFAEWKGRTDA